MIRKFAIAAAAIAALGTVSLSASTPAAAWGKGWPSLPRPPLPRRRAPRLPTGYNSCLRTRWVVNRFGELVLRTVNICY